MIFLILNFSICRYKKELIVAFALNLFCTALDLCIPFYLKEIMTYIEDKTGDVTRGRAIIFVVLILLTLLVSRIIRENFLFYQQKIGAKASQAVTGVLYNKVLKISSATNKKYKLGDIITFIQVDSRRLLFLFETLPSVSRLPFQIIFCIIYLYMFVGFTFLVALVLLSIFIILNYYLAIAIAKYQKVRMKAVDERTNAVSEVVDNIKLIKFYSWVERFMDKANETRNKELRILFKRLLLWVCNIAFFVVAYPILACSIFITADLWFGFAISVPYAVAILKVLTSLQASTRRLPFFIGQVVEFLIAMDRIQSFLLCDEIEKDLMIEHTKSPQTEHSISIQEGSFYWGFEQDNEDDKKKRKKKKKAVVESKDSESFRGTEVTHRNYLINDSEDSFLRESLLSRRTDTYIDMGKSGDMEGQQKTLLKNKLVLQEMGLKIKHGEFIAIIGEVGSGKSSIISSIIGDTLYIDDNTYEQFKNTEVLELRQGGNKEGVNKFNQEIFSEFENTRKETNVENGPKIRIEGSISMVQQTPWILNETVRNNILFGEELDEVKYNRTIDICQLARDLQILDGGDLTQIGEKGVGLSGGQKARLSIARAVYADKDIILMDDPLSALDAHVRKNIFDEVLCKQLKHKTRILVTHVVDFLDKVDRILGKLM